MSRRTDSKCKICRRAQKKLYLKGDRCYSDNCAVNRRQNLPGQSTGFTRRPSNYGLRLREKQNVKSMYGLNEVQMKNIFEKAKGFGGDKGLKLLQLLEKRLDNVIYMLGIAPSRAAARQLVSHGKIAVNNKKMSVPSYEVSVDDVVTILDKNVSPESASAHTVPGWLKKSSKGGTVVSEPVREMMPEDIRENLIIEFYSR